MKKHLFILFFLCYSIASYAQKDETATFNNIFYVRIDSLKPTEKYFHIYNGKIGGITIYMKNKYVNTQSFFSGYFNSDLTLLEKNKINPKDVMDYKIFNEILNKDFLNVALYCKVYLIISEDKINYLGLAVRPMLPPELNKM